MPRGWRIGRIGGVDIRVDPSLLVLAFLIGVTLWNLFSDPRQFRPASKPAAAGLAVLAVVLFFGSILAHELAHAGVSKLRHIPVRGITLFMFGGYTVGSREADTPTDELVIAGVSTNVGFHRRLLVDPAFRAGAIDIQFLDRRADLLAPVLSEREATELAVAAALAEDEARTCRRPSVANGEHANRAWLERGRLEGLR